MLNYNKYKIELQGDYMINLDLEKSLALDAQERYDIISFAMDAADDNGFINSFVFERALYCFAAVILYPEQKEIISKALAVNPVETWKTLVENGFIEQMQKDYELTLNQLAAEAEQWYKEYSDWAHSARGILNIVQQFTGDFIGNAAKTLKATMEESGAEQIIDIANEWGMGRDALKDAPKEEIKENSEESLFN